DFVPFCFQEIVCERSTHKHMIIFFEKRRKDRLFGRKFRTADDRERGRSRSERLAKLGHLLFQNKARIRGKKPRDSDNRRMRPMAGVETILHEYIREHGELFCESW